MADDSLLKKSMTLRDLVSFGVLSILGSGGFNLLGHAVVQAGPFWPATLASASAVFMGASLTYEEAFRTHPSNTSESDCVQTEFGPAASATTAIAILIFNIVSISTILVFCSHIMFPKGSWLGQIMVAIAAAALMAAFALQGIDVNKTVMNGVSASLVTVLALAGLLGIGGVALHGLPSAFRVKEGSLLSSFFYFFFILAGFDALIKFTEETKNPDDIPRSFYWSNGLAILLLLGAVVGYISWVDIKSLTTFDNPLGELFHVFLGGKTRDLFINVAVAFMGLTSFVVFLATTRYLYGLSDVYPSLSFLKSMNQAKVPDAAVYTTFGIASLAALLNHTEVLLRMSDAGLAIQLATVAAAATASQVKKGRIPLIEGATTAALVAVFASVFS